jgi:hypothetical protein
MDSDDYIPRSGRMPCYEPLCCNANRKPIPLFSLYNSLNFPDSIAINYCAPSHSMKMACTIPRTSMIACYWA